MTEPKPPGDVLSGRDEATPIRALNRVALVICGIALGLWLGLR